MSAGEPPAECVSIATLRDDPESYPWYPRYAMLCGYFGEGASEEPWFREREYVLPPLPGDPPPEPDVGDPPDDPQEDAFEAAHKLSLDREMRRFTSSIGGERRSIAHSTRVMDAQSQRIRRIVH